MLALIENPRKFDLLRSLDIIFLGKIGQLSAELLSTLDIILRKTQNINVFMGGIWIIFTIDHTQIQTIKGCPFLTSWYILSYFIMVALEHSLQASNYNASNWIQQISQYIHRRFIEEPELIDEFVITCLKKFTFVNSWAGVKIIASTVRLYSKKVPAKEASK